MAVRRPQRQVREYTTGEGHQLGEMPNIGTRFANEFPPECALDLVKSRLDFHGRPAAAPGSDRRLAVFSRALWLGRLATFLYALTLVVTISGMQAMCMFRDYCFRNKPATSPVALAMAFPVAAVVVLVLVPLGLASLRLRLRWLLGGTLVVLVAACVAMFIGSVWLLATTEPQALASVVSSSWSQLSVLEQRAYRGGQSELQSIVEGDAIVAGVFGLVATISLACAAVSSVLLWLQWTPGATDSGMCGARSLGPLKRLELSPTEDADKPSETEERSAPPARGGEADESDESDDSDAKPSRQAEPRAAGAERRSSRGGEAGNAADGKAEELDDTPDSGETGSDTAAASSGAAPAASGGGEESEKTTTSAEAGAASAGRAQARPHATPAGGADAKTRRR